MHTNSFNCDGVGTTAKVNTASRFDRPLNPRERLWTARGDTLHCVRGRTSHRLSIAEADARMRDVCVP